MMNVFESLGQAEMLRYEGNRQIAAALEQGARAMLRRLAAVFGEAPRRISDETPQR